MRQHYVLLLAVVVFLSSVNAASATTSSKFFTGDQVDSVTKRLLRTATAVNKDDAVDTDEERGRIPSLIRQASDLAKSGVKNSKALVKQYHVNGNFKFHKLDKQPLASPEMKTWADAVTKFFKNDPEGATKAMLTSLTKQYDETIVIRWAEAARRSPKVGKYGHNLMVVQFTKWMDEGLSPLDLAKLLKATAVRSDIKRDKVIVRAFANFIKTSRSIG